MRRSIGSLALRSRYILEREDRKIGEMESDRGGRHLYSREFNI